MYMDQNKSRKLCVLHAIEMDPNKRREMCVLHAIEMDPHKRREMCVLHAIEMDPHKRREMCVLHAIEMDANKRMVMCMLHACMHACMHACSASFCPPLLETFHYQPLNPNVLAQQREKALRTSAFLMASCTFSSFSLRKASKRRASSSSI